MKLVKRFHKVLKGWVRNEKREKQNVYLIVW